MTVDEMRDAVARCDEINALALAERWSVPHSVFDMMLRPEWQSTWALYLAQLSKAGAVVQETAIRSRTDSRFILWRGTFSEALDVEVAPIEGFGVGPSDIVIMYRWLGTDADIMGKL